jgi:hypothetical protein
MRERGLVVEDYIVLDTDIQVLKLIHTASLI